MPGCKRTYLPYRLPELGRTMMEMFAVLSIMCLLSVLGVLGYRLAINKYLTSELINESGKLALSCIVRLNEGPHVKAREDKYECAGFPEEMGTLRKEVNIYWQKGEFGVMAYGTRRSVCRMVVQANWREPIRIESAGS